MEGEINVLGSEHCDAIDNTVPSKPYALVVSNVSIRNSGI
jgi:hypothetical protein